MAIVIVNRADTQNLPSFEDELRPFCEKIAQSESFIAFIPKEDCLVAIGTLLTERRISYQLEFDTSSVFR